MVFNKFSLALAAALFLSLSVNFFLAGLMLGQAVSPHPPVTASEAQPRLSPDDARRAEWKKRDEALRAALSSADRAVVQKHTEANKESFEAMKAELDAARQRVTAALAAEPFDQDALDAAIEAETAAKAGFLREMYRARRAVMEELSPEGRKVFQEMNPMRRRGGSRPAADAEGPRGEGRLPPHMRERREGMAPPPMRRAPPPPGSPRPEAQVPPAP